MSLVTVHWEDRTVIHSMKAESKFSSRSNAQDSYQFNTNYVSIVAPGADEKSRIVSYIEML